MLSFWSSFVKHACRVQSKMRSWTIFDKQQACSCFAHFSGGNGCNCVGEACIHPDACQDFWSQRNHLDLFGEALGEKPPPNCNSILWYHLFPSVFKHPWSIRKRFRYGRAQKPSLGALRLDTAPLGGLSRAPPGCGAAPSCWGRRRYQAELWLPGA